MKTLFLNFSLLLAALALFLVLAILVMLAFRPSVIQPGTRCAPQALTDAIAAYEHGGTQQAHDYLENLQRTHHVRA